MGVVELVRGNQIGPWRIEYELGRGGMGIVYAVVHEAIGKQAAIKLLHDRDKHHARMLIEAQAVNAIDHPNIVDIFGSGTLDDGTPYLVMQRLDGETLADRADCARILPDEVIEILLQICDALIAAHAAGVIHRDLKLENIFLIDNHEAPRRPRVKVCDWGIAKLSSSDARLTVEGLILGTPQYLAPEQALGRPITPQCDVYALGVIAYELFLELLPFNATTTLEMLTQHVYAEPMLPRAAWPTIPVALEQLLLAMLAKDPAQRPTMVGVAQALQALRDGAALPSAPDHHAPRASTPPTLAMGDPAAKRLLDHPAIIDASIANGHAFVVLRAGARLSPEHVLEFCRETIPGADCPRSVTFMKPRHRRASAPPRIP